MRRRRTAFVARSVELAALDAALAESSRRGRLVLLRGPVGIGKTALLRAATRRWRADGVQVIAVRWAGDDDPLGFQAIVDAVRDHFEQLHQPRLAGSIDLLDRLSVASRATPHAPVLGLVLGLGSMFDLIAGGRPTVLVADDVDAVPAPALALGAVAGAGCLVVAAGTGQQAAMTQLATIAEEIHDLPPLSDDQVETMIAQTRGVSLDDGLLPALRTALGPLVGVPGTVLATLGDLDHCGRLAVVGEHLCLIDPAAAIPLPDDHDLVVRIRSLGSLATRLATTVAVTSFGVDDLPLLAEATRGRLTEYGRLVDRMVSDGVLTVDARGGLAPRCAALAARLISDAGASGVRRLHRALAAALLRRVGLGGRADRAVLADHVTSAGPAIPFDETIAAWLADVAATATDTDADRAAGWLRAAAWHIGVGAAAGEIYARLVRLLMRTGQFHRLTEVVQAAIGAGEHGSVPNQDQRADLATAAVLAAVHTGRPVESTTWRALAGAGGPSGAAHLHARWFGEPLAADAPPPDQTTAAGALITPDELDRITSSLTYRPVVGSDEERGAVHVGADAVLAAGSAGNLVAVFELVLGERYRVPTGGVLAAYHRQSRSYALGDFADALSAAREVELTGSPSTVVYQVARLFAAETQALQGNHRPAAALLAAVPAVPAYQALRAWVGCGLADRFGGPADRSDAVGEGWRAYQTTREHGSRIGVEQLLPRLAALATRVGDHATARAILAEVEALYRDGARRIGAEPVLMVRASVGRDLAAATRAVELVHRRADRPALVAALLMMSGLADDPRPWLLRAYDVVKTVDSGYLRSSVNAAMRERGVAAPRTRAPRERLSATENQIVELIRHGQTNRQMAAALRMSEKTVENYLTRLFARTGCRSRVELAAASLSGHVLGAAS